MDTTLTSLPIIIESVDAKFTISLTTNIICVIILCMKQ